MGEQNKRSMWTRNSTLMSAFRLYDAMGLLIAILSAGFFAVKKLNITIDSVDRLTLMFFASGLMLVVLSRVALQLLKAREAVLKLRLEDELQGGRLVRLWSTFEGTASAHLGEDISDRPVPTRSLIYKLIETGAVTPAQAEDLEQALDIRNAVAHGRGESFPPELISTSIVALEEILRVLQRPKSKARRTS